MEHIPYENNDPFDLCLECGDLIPKGQVICRLCYSEHERELEMAEDLVPDADNGE